MTDNEFFGLGLRHVSSKDNPEYRHLFSVKEKAEIRREEGLCWLEGPRLVQQFLHAMAMAQESPTEVFPWACETLVFSQDWLHAQATQADWQDLLSLLTRFVDQALVLPDRLFARLAETHAPAGIGLLVRTHVLRAPEEVLNGLTMKGDGLILDGVQDPGNLGSLLRTAAAAGLRWAAVTKGSADPFSPKCLRAGMGAQFMVSLIGQQEPESLATALRAGGVDLFAADPVLGASLYSDAIRGRLQKPLALAWVMGQEGRGLSDYWETAQGINKVFIPQSNRMESLNVGAAAAVCLFERRRCLNEV
jgi:TrmH family RNA methyltransferase